MTQSVFDTLIPRPAQIEAGQGSFTLTSSTRIVTEAGSQAAAVGHFLAEYLRPATGFALPLEEGKAALEAGHICLALGAETGPEGYCLHVTPEGVLLSAAAPAGLFYGVQTIRQLLPAAIERKAVQPGPWQLPAGKINDAPRYAWRGMMLDVARHFFGVDTIKHLIDLLALYKLNRLHLHLTDDQGWRVMINSWPKLAEVGGSSSVDGDRPGYYTQTEYASLAAYAQSRFVTIVPEVDLPGHTNAALASYAELNADGIARELYTGTKVGFSTLTAAKEVTFQFLDDVIRELAQITPGEYLHIGGDEAAVTPKADYLQIMERAQQLAQKYGKKSIGWNELAQVDLLPSTLVHYWVDKLAQKAIEQGARVVMSPAKHTYLDMKYTPETSLGLNWAAYIEVQDAYNWDPAKIIEGIGETQVEGVEAPLWAETLHTQQDIEYLVFPRLPGLAEVSWTPQALRQWEDYRLRLAEHSPRFAALGLKFYASPQVPWPPEALS
jgi:hexosaminidase